MNYKKCVVPSIVLAVLVLFGTSSFGRHRTPGSCLWEDSKEVLLPRSDAVFMTRNMYLGAPVGPLADASGFEIAFRGGELFKAFRESNVKERIANIVTEIAITRPHLVGLQEVVRVHSQTPSDFIFGENTLPDVEEADFLKLLEDELQARRMEYRVVKRWIMLTSRYPL